MSRVLATSSERFHLIKIQIQELSSCLSWVIRQNVIRQLATISENVVASTQFLVALVPSESQFQALTVEQRYIKGS